VASSAVGTTGTPRIPGTPEHAASKPTRFGRSAVALSIVASSLGLAIVTSASPASATPSTPNPATIACTTSTAYLSQNSPTQLYAEAFGSGTIAFNPVGSTTPGLTYNAIGIDPLNGYLYGIETNPTARDLLRINPTTGVVEDLGQLSPAPAGSLVAGAFDSAGNFYASSSNGTTLYKIDVVAGTSSSITMSAAAGLADYTYVGGYFFGLNSSATPVRINPATGVVNTFTALAGVTAATFGAAFTLGNGDADFGSNSGGVTEVEIDNPGAASPTFTVISGVSTASTTSNDGAACVSAATHLSVATTAPASVTPGASVTWTFTITNAGPGASSGYSLSEVLPTGYIKGTLPAGCSASGQTVTCTRGALADGATSTIAIPATAPGSAGCATNSATVSGNEADADPENSDSTSSAGICVTGSNPQAITFAQPADVSAAAGTTTLSATATSLLGVTFTSDTTGVCTVSGTTVTLLASGTCTIDADQAGDSTYAAAATVTKSFAISPIAQTITFTQPDDVNLTSGTVDVAASADSTLPITFSSDTAAICTVSGNTVTMLAVGTCTIDADQPGDATHAAAPTVTESFDVTTASQLITFNQPADVNLAAGSVGLTATADSTLAVSYTSDTTDVCTVSGTTLTLAGVGTCTIEADQAGNSRYSAAPTVTQSFAVGAVAQTITFTQPADTALTAGTVALTAAADSNLAVAYTSSTTGVCTVSGTTVTLVSAGICTIDADQAGDDTHAAAPTITRSFNVTSPSPPPSNVVQTITFGPLNDTDANAGPVTVTASSDSNLTVTFTSGTTGVCTVSGTSVTLVGVGTCTIDADQAGDSTYAAASTFSRSFAVTATPQTITFGQPANTNITADTLDLTGTVNSALTVTYTSATATICTVSGTTVTLLGVGTCTIDADQAGDETHAAAPTVAQSFLVTAAPQLITFARPADVNLATGTATLTATADSTLPVSYTSSTTSICTVAANIVTLIGVGTCTIDADQEGDSNVAAAPTVTQSFNVAAIVQTITFAQPADRNLASGIVILTGYSDAGLMLTYSSSTTGVCTVSGRIVSLLTAGTCTINADQEGDTTHAEALTVTRSFTVSPLSQLITFAQPAALNLGTGSTALTATANSLLTPTFTSTTPLICSVSGSTVTAIAVGTCTIQADQAGDASYAAAPTVTRSFAITAIAQTITFAQPADVNLAAGTVTLTGSADSELPVSFSSSTSAVCTVSGSTVTLLTAGTCTIAADQEGDGTHAGASTVTRSFAVIGAVIPSGGSTPVTPPLPVVTVDRIGGTDRDATAAQLATTMYPTAGSASVVVLARDDLYADGLTGSPLANALNGPLLLTATATLSPATLAAIEHVLPAGGSVICLGGANAISPGVLDQLQGLGYHVQRIGGADRYATATLIANDIFATTSVTNVYLATGQNFADALPAADAAGLTHGVVLLTANTAMPSVTSAWMTGHAGLATTAVGGSAAAADPTATPIVGADRYATAAKVAITVAPAATGIVLATGIDFPDGLAGATYAVHNGWSLLLLNPQASGLNSTQSSYLGTAAATVTSVTAIGGTSALPTTSTGLVTDDLN
jgi:putative cell wall-binding protein